MTSTPERPTLTREFPHVDRAQWVRAAAKALVRDLAPEADPEPIVARLRSTTYDGIVIEPLYTRHDASDRDGAGHDVEVTSGGRGVPGSSPFVRGRTSAANRAQGWDVRQIVDASSVFTALEELERGATSLWLSVDGLETIDVAALGAALDGVYLELTSVTLASGHRWADGASALLQLWDQQHIDPADATGSFGADPVGGYASSGGASDVLAELAAASDVALRMSASHPHVRVFAVDGTRYHECGASDGQELGFAIAGVVATMRTLVESGMDITSACRQIELRLAATSDQFATIAKFRAARRLLARVAEVAGTPAAAGEIPLHAVTSAAMMSRYDPWVNLLRGTLACFGAAIGGADVVTVLPYDHEITATGSEIGRRIARNTQSILAKESHLARVIDPAGGSYFVETLTDQLAEAAWLRFREVERAGGLVAAVDSGHVERELEQGWRARRRNIVTRRDPLTGVSEFPDVFEPVPPARSSRRPAIMPNALVRHRYAEPFEDLRGRVDRYAQNAPRPSVFLANLGAPAVHTARASFAKNLFEVGGLLTIPGPGTTDPAELAEQFAASGASVACICSSDRMYASVGAEAAAALRRHDPAAVFVAGRPKDVASTLVDAGVDACFAVGDDVEQFLLDVLLRMDVP